MFTTLPVKRGVGGCKIDSKGLSKIRGTGMCEPPFSTFYIVYPLKHELCYYIKGIVTVLYIKKRSLGLKEYKKNVKPPSTS